ncbi:MAG: hypothetical protein COU70_01100, partial [Parcubacteria group bacterium CG10_big_fil_rev_8_21_14_0_10_35_15]
MKRFSKIIIITILLIASTSFGFYIGEQEGERKAVNQFFSQGAGENASNLDFTLFWETWQTLKEKFIDKT